jgi:8-oxo-dGTP diphosphatase
VTDPARHSVSVSAVVVDEKDQVLLIRRRDNGEWQAPGGVLELDEDIHAGLRREVLEETGYTVEPLRLTGVYKSMPLGVVALVFRCQVVDGTAQPSEETSDVAWVLLRDIPAQLTEAFAVRVIDAISDTSPVAVRAHDGRKVNHPHSGRSHAVPR